MSSGDPFIDSFHQVPDHANIIARLTATLAARDAEVAGLKADRKWDDVFSRAVASALGKSMEHGFSAKDVADALAAVTTERDSMRETNAKLNRRCQEAESTIHAQAAALRVVEEQLANAAAAALAKKGEANGI